MPDDIGEMREERRVVTALFADIVGSTPLGERLDPEDLKLIVADAVARMIDAIETFGGIVKDLAGDGVLALFGAPVAHEDDAERAIRAGLRILDEIAEFATEVERGWGVGGFGVRVGVDTGLVVVGAIGAGGRVEYSALGDAGEHRGPAPVPRRARHRPRRRGDAPTHRSRSSGGASRSRSTLKGKDDAGGRPPGRSGGRGRAEASRTRGRGHPDGRPRAGARGSAGQRSTPCCQGTGGIL